MQDMVRDDILQIIGEADPHGTIELYGKEILPRVRGRLKSA